MPCSSQHFWPVSFWVFSTVGTFIHFYTLVLPKTDFSELGSESNHRSTLDSNRTRCFFAGACHRTHSTRRREVNHCAVHGGWESRTHHRQFVSESDGCVRSSDVVPLLPRPFFWTTLYWEWLTPKTYLRDQKFATRSKSIALPTWHNNRMWISCKDSARVLSVRPLVPCSPPNVDSFVEKKRDDTLVLWRESGVVPPYLSTLDSPRQSKASIFEELPQWYLEKVLKTLDACMNADGSYLKTCWLGNYRNFAYPPQFYFFRNCHPWCSQTVIVVQVFAKTWHYLFCSLHVWITRDIRNDQTSPSLDSAPSAEIGSMVN